VSRERRTVFCFLAVFTRRGVVPDLFTSDNVQSGGKERVVF